MKVEQVLYVMWLLLHLWVCWFFIGNSTNKVILNK
jgi:hypothetical protein